jgi:hypothetical protein
MGIAGDSFRERERERERERAGGGRGGGQDRGRWRSERSRVAGGRGWNFAANGVGRGRVAEGAGRIVKLRRPRRGDRSGSQLHGEVRHIPRLSRPRSSAGRGEAHPRDPGLPPPRDSHNEGAAAQDVPASQDPRRRPTSRRRAAEIILPSWWRATASRSRPPPTGAAERSYAPPLHRVNGPLRTRRGVTPLPRRPPAILEPKRAHPGFLGTGTCSGRVRDVFGTCSGRGRRAEGLRYKLATQPRGSRPFGCPRVPGIFGESLGMPRANMTIPSRSSARTRD